MAACAPCRIAAGNPSYSSKTDDSATAPADLDRIDPARLDERFEVRRREADMTTDLVEHDAPLCDQSADEPLRSEQVLRGLRTDARSGDI